MRSKYVSLATARRLLNVSEREVIQLIIEDRINAYVYVMPECVPVDPCKSCVHSRNPYLACGPCDPSDWESIGGFYALITSDVHRIIKADSSGALIEDFFDTFMDLELWDGVKISSDDLLVRRCDVEHSGEEMPDNLVYLLLKRVIDDNKAVHQSSRKPNFKKIEELLIENAGNRQTTGIHEKARKILSKFWSDQNSH